MMRLNVTLIILAGGQSRRMGKDKGLLIYNGKTFIKTLIDNFRITLIDTLLVSNHDEHQKVIQQYKYPLIKQVFDEKENFGPVVGVYSGLKNSETEWNFIVSCDSPLVNVSVLKELLENYDENYDIIQFKVNGKTSPLNALYHKKCLPVFENAIQKNQKRLMGVLENLNVKTITPSDAIVEKLKNVNTVEEYSLLKKR